MRIRNQRATTFSLLLFLANLLLNLFLLQPAGAEVQKEPPIDENWLRKKLIGKDKNLFLKATQAEADKKWKKAAKIYRKMATIADARKAAAWAAVNSGDMFVKADQHNKAFEMYQVCLNEHPELVPYEEVLSKLRDIGDYFAKNDKKLLGMKLWQKPRAISVYEFIVEQAPFGEHTPKDTLHLARLQWEAQRYEDAKKTYESLITRYHKQPVAQTGRLELARMLLSMSEEERKREELALYAKRMAQRAHTLAKAPADKKKAQELIDMANAELGAYYLRLAQFYNRDAHYQEDTVIRYAQLVLKDYPNTQAANQARTLLIDKGVDVPPESDKQVQPKDEQASKQSGKKKTVLSPLGAAMALREKDKGKSRSLPFSEITLPEFDTLGVGKIENATNRPDLTTLLRRQLCEHVQRDSGATLKDADNADLIINSKLLKFETGRRSAVKLDKPGNNIREDRNTYQTAIFTATVNIRYRVKQRETGEVVLDWRTIEGKTDFPLSPDQEVTREDGLRRAVNSAADKIVYSLTESW